MISLENIHPRSYDRFSTKENFGIVGFKPLTPPACASEISIICEIADGI